MSNKPCSQQNEKSLTVISKYRDNINTILQIVAGYPSAREREREQRGKAAKQEGESRTLCQSAVCGSECLL